jgi:hypothetical protein
MGRMQREKGKRWEREVAGYLRDIFGEKVCRGWQARLGSDDPDVKNVPRQWVECKHDNGISVHAAMVQAITEMGKSRASPDTWPVVYFKRDRTEPLAVMRLKDFLDLLRDWWTWHQDVQRATVQFLTVRLYEAKVGALRAAAERVLSEMPERPGAVTISMDALNMLRDALLALKT